ncbi:MAG: DUF4349 domain-containing protein [Clostridia bacterium]|nr:DUF4349 domain-containing protein [Clostridia bacterium]
MKKFFKKNWKHIIAYVLVFCFGIGFCALIGGSGSSKSYDTVKSVGMTNTYAYTGDNDGMPEEMALDQSTNSKVKLTADRKLVKNANLYLETEKYQATLKALNESVVSYGGYVESSNESKYGDYAFTSLCLRIPSDKLDKFLNETSEIATVTSKSVSMSDITDSYVDTESHLKSLRIEQETLMGLLEKAESLSDTITIQDRLTEVRSQIEYYQSMMNRYDNQVDYSTVEINVSEVGKESPTGEGYFAKIWLGLKESFYNIGEGFKSIVMFIIVNIPYLLILGLVAVVVCVIIKKVKSKKKVDDVKEETFTE